MKRLMLLIERNRYGEKFPRMVENENGDYYFISEVDKELATLCAQLAEKDATIASLISVQERVEKALSDVGMPDSNTPTPEVIRMYFGEVNNLCKELGKDGNNLRAQLAAVTAERDAFRENLNRIAEQYDSDELTQCTECRKIWPFSASELWGDPDEGVVGAWCEDGDVFCPECWEKIQAGAGRGGAEVKRRRLHYKTVAIEFKVYKTHQTMMEVIKREDDTFPESSCACLCYYTRRKINIVFYEGNITPGLVGHELYHATVFVADALGEKDEEKQAEINEWLHKRFAEFLEVK